MRKYMGILSLVVFLTSCAHYDPTVVKSLAGSHQNDTEITEQLCSDFYSGSEALKDGPQKAWPLLGKAREIESMSVILKKQGAACYEADSRELGTDLEFRALEAFKRTWREAERVVE